MKFIHLSDLHFRSKPQDNLDAVKVLEFVRQTYPRHYLIITGDLVDDGHAEQYKRVSEALEPFLGRLFFCPGNHDFGAKGNLYSPERAARFDRYLSIPFQQRDTFAGGNLPVINLLQEGPDQILLIALDTNLETISPFDFACGQVGAKQLTALHTLLSDPSTATMTKIVFLHHHPFVHSDRLRKLLDAQELLQVVENRIHLMLFGHKHLSGMWRDLYGIPFILASDNSPGKQIAREITIVQNTITVQDIRLEDEEWDVVL